jgi:hypothetical protein
MKSPRISLANGDVLELELAVPPGHHHLRAVLRLRDGGEVVLQEATVANLVRAYVDLKTHPFRESVCLAGRELNASQRKEGFAAWQLLEGR